jgi:hypothetical protein
MALMRAVTDGEGHGHMAYNNYRPVQMLHDRKVYTNVEASSAAAVSTYMGALVAGLALVLFM